MVVDLHTDTEMMRDGSRRWLWQIRHNGRLWRAGICSSMIVAESESGRAVRELHSKLAPQGKGPPAEGIPPEEAAPPLAG